jgi:hypothetical protein
MWSASSYVAVGFVWGAVAYFLRPPRDVKFAKRWMTIDIVQVAITVALIYGHKWRWFGDYGDICVPVILAAVYVLCLYVDFAVGSRPPK